MMVYPLITRPQLDSCQFPHIPHLQELSMPFWIRVFSIIAGLSNYRSKIFPAISCFRITTLAIGRTAGPPWVADQRHAAAAAWLALS
jgi:hypothetical protein